MRNFHMQTFILYAAPAANNFLGVSVFLQTLLFTCIHFISVFTASANNLFYDFPAALHSPPPPPSKNNGPPLKLKPCRYSVRADFLLVFCFNRKKFWQKRKKPTRKRIEIQGTDLKGTTQKGKIDATTKQGSTKRKRQPGKIWQKKVKILNT